MLELADYLLPGLVIAAFKLKFGICVGRHFAADAELSFKADLSRLRKAISDQLSPPDIVP